MKKYQSFLTATVFGVGCCLAQASTMGAQLDKHADTTQKASKVTVQKTPVNLNTANLKGLLSLKGIGKKKAATILKWRHQHGRFKTLSELKRLPGFSKRMIDKLILNKIPKITI